MRASSGAAKWRRMPRSGCPAMLWIVSCTASR
jgi:hypothetical protein